MIKMLRGYFRSLLESPSGESYGKILQYFFPEFITAIVLYSLPYLVDSIWIAQLGSTAKYATLGAINTWMHFLVKVAEGLSIGTVVLTGINNGKEQYEKAGRVLVSAFWMTIFIGLCVSLVVYFFGYGLFLWYNVEPEVYALGLPFLKIRAFGVFFSFLYFAFVGFLRGIKNTVTPMIIFIVGVSLFLCADYALIFGKWGFPALGLQGSGIATVLQYATMCLLSALYILYSSRCRKYNVRLLCGEARWQHMKQLFRLSWPVMVDKGIFAAAFIWLGRCIASTGDTTTLASFAAIKDVERLAILPSVALAQVTTALVSNAWAKEDKAGIDTTVKRVLSISFLTTLIVVIFCVINAKYIFNIFDKNGEFSAFSARAFPIISILIFFDLLQLILASALRGSGDVRMVMWTRLTICLGFFAPVSYFFSVTPMGIPLLRFVLIFSSLYLGTAIMGIVYVRHFFGATWKQRKTKDIDEYKQRRSIKNS